MSRRDRLIVARHEVPGWMQRGAPSRRDGRSYCQSLMAKLRNVWEVQSSRWGRANFRLIPATSCLATIVLSLRDKTILNSVFCFRPRLFSWPQVGPGHTEN